MRNLIILILNPFIAIVAESQQSDKSQVITLSKNNGDTIIVAAQVIDGQSDTILVTVHYLQKGKKRQIQRFKTSFSYPLTTEPTYIDKKLGFLIKYDPAARNGNSFLYLFDENKDVFIEVKGFRDLGMIEPLQTADLFYSYTPCGCGDNCWNSKLFKIEKFKIVVKAELSCNCFELIEKTGSKTKQTNSCNNFNTDTKFEKIANYWKDKEKNGL